MLDNNCILVAGAFGYIGNALTQRLLLEGYKVIGIDNNSREENVREVGSYSATQQPPWIKRYYLFNNIGNYEHLNFDITENDGTLEKIIEAHRPFTIVNLAHQPSGPYSMINADHANYSLTNNIIGTNNFLWAIKNTYPDIHYTTIGTTGEYQHTINVPIEEGYFVFESKGRKSEESLFPRRPTSIYHSCYDDKTEVLTKNGWKFFNEISYNDKIATLNQKNDSLEYQYPTNIFKYNYNGELINIKNKNVDINVTPNHNIFTHTNYKSNLLNWRLETAESIYNKSRCIKRSVSKWNGKNCTITIPEVEVKINGNKTKKLDKIEIEAKNFIDFFGWWITEGSVYKNRINISQNKQCNLDFIRDSFNKLNINRKLTRNLKSENNNIIINGYCIYHYQIAKYLKDTFGKSLDKFIPKNIKNLPTPLLKRLLDIMIKGDGTSRENHNKFSAIFYTSSKQLADDIQEIALKCNYVAVINTIKRENKYNKEYNINISENDTTQLIMSKSVNDNKKSKTYSKNLYNGKIYCCEVPNSIIYIRRNGRPCWCGNSKVSSLYLIEYLTKIWNLRTTEAEQAVVFGLYTDETDKTEIYSRLDTDSCFGTVLNKFIVQAMLDIPLTIFGEGKHQRGFLALQNSIDAIMLSIEQPPERGKLRIFNQLSETWSINELAHKVNEYFNKIIGKELQFNYQTSPRKEYTGDHYYKYISDILPSMGYVPTRTIEDEIEYIFNILSNNREHIEGLRDTITKNISF